MRILSAVAIAAILSFSGTGLAMADDPYTDVMLYGKSLFAQPVNPVPRATVIVRN